MADTYLKPQSPLKHMDDFIYPLTTADQVIVDDNGTRLNDAMSGILYAELVDSDAGGFAINATTVGGETPESMYNTLHPVGSIYMTATNTNPADTLGFGIWELVGKSFKDWEGSDADGAYFAANATNVTAHKVAISRAGSVLTIHLGFTNAVIIDTTELVMGTFNWEAIGISSLPTDLFYLLGGSVNGADAYLYRVYSNGDVHVWKYVSSTIDKGSTCYSSFSVAIPYEFMLDSACDKFYWKRTA